jgi:glycosyltransferase involved in cell wall biosynthesis
MTLIWHEAGNAAYWDRFRALARFFDVQVFGLTSFQGRRFRPPEKPEPFRLTLFDARGAGHWLTFISPAMLAALWRTPADVIYLHEEPHALTSFAVSLLKRRRTLVIDSAVINTRGWFGGRNVLEQATYRAIDLAFVRNAEVAEVIVRRGLDPAKLRGVLGNGVSRATFHPTERRAARAALGQLFPIATNALTSGRLVLAYAGRIWRPKGLAVLAKLRERLPCEILVCGEVIDSDVARELAGAGAVVLPRLDVPDLRTFFSAADLFVLPSEPTPGWREQFGRVLVESIACGTPAIGSRLGAIPSILGDDAVFEAGDLSSLTDVAKRFQGADDRAALLRRQSERLDANFTWEAIAARVAAVTEHAG